MTVAERCRELTDRFELPPRSAEKLNALLKFVITGPSSLTNVRDPAAAVELHIADSLAGLELRQIRAATTIADLGSGGGFPGLVLAIALPDAQLTLVESAARKADFLRETAEAMTLDNVAVVAERAELWALEAREQDVVTSRALASTSILLEYAAPLLRVGGSLVAWKGSLGDGEGLVGGARIDHQPLGAEIGRRQHGVEMPGGVAGDYHRRDGQGRLVGPRARR